MQKNVALVLANLRGNVGDFAILETNLEIISTLFPKASIDVYYQPHPQIDLARTNRVLSSFPQVALRFPHPFATSGNHRSRVERLLHRLFRKTVQSASVGVWMGLLRNHAESFSQYRAVFVSGGEHYNHKTGATFFALIRAISWHAPIYSLPFAFNRSVESHNSRIELLEAFSCFERPILVRDSYTAGLLAKLGLDVALCGDSVHILADRINFRKEPPRSSTALFALTGSDNDRSIRKVLSRDQGAQRTYLLLSTRQYLDEEFLRSLSKDMRVEVQFPMHWLDLISTIQKASVVVTNLLHVAYFARMSGVPILLVADRAKIRQFALDTGIPVKRRVSQVTPDALERATQNSTVRETLAEQVQEARDALFDSLTVWRQTGL